MRVGVYGLWHLGSVTAACLAEAGHDVVGVDTDPAVVAGLRSGRPPLGEPGLPELVASGLAARRLSFDASLEALADVEALWVTIDTPVDDQDEADVAAVSRSLAPLEGVLSSGTLVLVSSQVPVGFTRRLAGAWAGRGLRFACSPENLRLGSALESFRRSDRIVVGVQDAPARDAVERLLRPLRAPILWTSLEAAEMTKHALNAFLATSVAFANEVARLCERVGADAREVERGLKTDARIGPLAYLAPGPAFAGGTLARDLRYLVACGERGGASTPLLSGVLESNAAHGRAIREEVRAFLSGPDPVVAILGLTYKPGTTTLRRSASLELARELAADGVRVRAHDPAIQTLPEGVSPLVTVCASALEALRGADVAVLATAWAEYRELVADDVASGMRRAQVVDPGGFLEGALGSDPRILYRAAGRPRARG